MGKKNSVIDTSAFIIYNFFNIIISFIIPRIIIANYGSDVNGLSSSISQVINIINLLQAGTVGASIYEMYKPIVLNDNKTVGAIYYSARSYFRKISWIFFFLCLLIIPYILIFGKSKMTVIDISLSVVILGLSSTLTFRYRCPYIILICAYQKRYISVISDVIERLVYFFSVLIVVCFDLHFLLLFLAHLIGIIAKLGFLTFQFKTKYEKQIRDYCGYTSYKIKNQYKLLGNQITENSVNSISNLLITGFAGLIGSSIASLYLMISNVLKYFFDSIVQGFASPFGSLIARKDFSKVQLYFDFFQILFLVLSFVILGTAIVLYVPFINLYTNGINDVNYLVKPFAISLSLMVACFAQHYSYHMLVEGMGLFGKIFSPTLFCGFFSFALMLVLSFGVGYEFVFFGVVFFYFLSFVMRFLVIKKESQILTYKNLIRSFIPIAYLMLLTVIPVQWVKIVSSWYSFITYGFFLVFINLFISLSYCIIFENKLIKDFVSVLRRKI